MSGRNVRHARQACDRCRAKKTRCEGGPPCFSCSKANQACAWSNPVDNGAELASRVAAIEAYLSVLAPRLRANDCTLPEYTPSSSPLPSTSPLSPPAPADSLSGEGHIRRQSSLDVGFAVASSTLPHESAPRMKKRKDFSPSPSDLSVSRSVSAYTQAIGSVPSSVLRSPYTTDVAMGTSVSYLSSSRPQQPLASTSSPLHQNSFGPHAGHRPLQSNPDTTAQASSGVDNNMEVAGEMQVYLHAPQRPPPSAASMTIESTPSSFWPSHYSRNMELDTSADYPSSSHPRTSSISPLRQNSFGAPAGSRPLQSDVNPAEQASSFTGNGVPLYFYPSHGQDALASHSHAGQHSQLDVDPTQPSSSRRSGPR